MILGSTHVEATGKIVIGKYILYNDVKRNQYKTN